MSRKIWSELRRCSDWGKYCIPSVITLRSIYSDKRARARTYSLKYEHNGSTTVQVVCKGMGLLCNLARSAECSALMVEHGVVALIAGSLLRHQVQCRTGLGSCA